MLLTGAGFSVDFDGLLARDMADHLARDESVQRDAELKALLGGVFSFEEVYERVVFGTGFTSLQPQLICRSDVLALWRMYQVPDGG